MILIRGASGTGKSVLVENFRQMETKKELFFVSGKFNQYDNARLYGAFAEATAELAFAISERKDQEQLETIRARVMEMLSQEDIDLLIGIMPIVEFIIPKNTTKVPQRKSIQPNKQTFHRFMDVYRKFLRCVCSAKNPLIVFLDDLQWLDDVSRQLLDSIAKDEKLQNLLVIGAVRQDLGAKGVYELTAEAVMPCAEITIDSLTLDDVNVIVSRATARAPSDKDTRDLSAVVVKKTGGNAYFVVQFLEMLHRENLLVFDFLHNTRWEWDAARIDAQTNVSDNVVQVLIRKIESLPADVQIVLIVAACLGFSFRVDTLELILETLDCGSMPKIFLKENNVSLLPMNKLRVQQALDEAIRNDLIMVLSETKCKFTHDRVQQSAHSILPDGDEERTRFQTALGKILLDLSKKEAVEDWMVFAAVDLLSATPNGSNNTTLEPKGTGGQPDQEFSKICLEAAKKAAKKAAFYSAAKYADTGIRRLGCVDKTSDEGRYDLWLELSNLSAEMHYCRGDFAESTLVIKRILLQSRSVDHCFRAYRVSISIHSSTEDWAAAVDCGIHILNDLGVVMPRNPGTFNVVAALMRTKWLMKGRKPSDLEQLAPMTNQRMAEAIFFLGATAFCSWCKGEENRCNLYCLKMFILTLEYGMAADSPYAFSAYGLCLCHIGEYSLAHEYGVLAMKMLERPGMEQGIAKVSVVVHNFLNYLKNPIQESLEPLLAGYRSGMQYGDVVQAAYALRGRAGMGLFAGVHLAEHERELLSFCEFFKEFRQYGTMKMVAPWLQLTQNLLGKAQDVFKLTGDAMDEDVTLRNFSGESSTLKGNPSLAFVFYNLHYAKRALLYTFGCFEMTDEDRQQTARLGGESTTLYTNLFDFCFCCLTCLAMAREGKRVRYYKQQARIYRKQLSMRAEQGCVNCVPLLALISAEKHALKDKSGGARALYREAIVMLGRCGFRLFKAIACERAAEYLLECGCRDIATDYLQQAWNEFHDYGAHAKNIQLREKHKGTIAFSEHMLRSSSRSSTRLKAHSIKRWQQDVSTSTSS